MGREGRESERRSFEEGKNGVGAAVGLIRRRGGNELVLPVEGPGPASSTDGVGLGVSLTAVREESRAEGGEWAGGEVRKEGRGGEVEDLGLRFD